MRLVTRAAWGAQAATSRTAAPGMTRGVGVHWLGPGAGRSNHSQCAAQMREVQAFHMGPSRNWADYAYNAAACSHGYVFEGRGPRIRNAANGGGTRNGVDANAGWASVLYLAGTDGPALTDAAKDAINDAAEWLGVAAGEWLGHRDFLNTECPGNDIYRWVHGGHRRGTAPGPTPEETFVPGTSILTLAHSGLVLDVRGASKENGAAIVQWPLNGQKHQLVRFEDAGDGWEYVVFEHSGKVLDHDPNTGVVHQIVKMAENPNQLWKRFAVAGNVVALVCKADDQVLDLPAIDTTRGVRIATWRWNGGPNQLVAVTAVGT